jgi:hypothetical protein
MLHRILYQIRQRHLQSVGKQSQLYLGRRSAAQLKIYLMQKIPGIRYGFRGLICLLRFAKLKEKVKRFRSL